MKNSDFELVAQNKETIQSIGINLIVDSIDRFIENVKNNSYEIILLPTDHPEVNSKNAVFRDHFNQLWR